MLVWGTRSKSLDLGPVDSRHCPRCGSERTFHLLLTYAHHHLWLLFGWASGKRYFEVCKICGHGPQVESDAVETRLGRNPIPAWHRFGILGLVGGIAALILFGVLLRLTGPEVRNIPDLVERMQRGDETAVAQLRREAEAGDLPSQQVLADLLAGGPEKFRDLEEAFRWTHAAADQGSALALLSLGSRYEAGAGVEADPAEALRWYRLAADQGVVAAWNRIGRLVHDGVGTPADPTEAARLFRRAAEGGDAEGMLNYGIACLDGDDGAVDPVRAAEWFAKAAAAPREDPAGRAIRAEAAFRLGALYESGTGVERNLLEALHQYEQASPVRDDARQAVERLSRGL